MRIRDALRGETVPNPEEKSPCRRKVARALGAVGLVAVLAGCSSLSSPARGGSSALPKAGVVFDPSCTVDPTPDGDPSNPHQITVSTTIKNATTDNSPSYGLGSSPSNTIDYAFNYAGTGNPVPGTPPQTGQDPIYDLVKFEQPGYVIVTATFVETTTSVDKDGHGISSTEDISCNAFVEVP